MIFKTVGRHLAHNAVAYLALAMATSGTAYAAATIGSAEVVDDSLRSIDIRDDTSTNGGLAGSDIRPNTLTNLDIAEQTLEKVPNADSLDGLDSTAFVQGSGALESGALAIGKGSGGFFAVLNTSNPAITVGYNCPADLAANGVMVFRNNSPELVNVFSDNGSSNPEYRQLPASGGRWDQFAAANGEHFTFQLQGSRIATIEVFSVHRPASNDCHVQAMAVTRH